MTFAVGAIVTDIEGTTSSIAFVKDVLFPYARARLDAFISARADDAAPNASSADAITDGTIE